MFCVGKVAISFKRLGRVRVQVWETIFAIVVPVGLSSYVFGRRCTRIHGRPTRSDYEILKQEAATIASEVEEIIYTWSRSTTTGDEYGLLGDILGVDEYDHQTGIDTYVEETEPDTYDGTINDATPTHTRKRKEEEWERLRTCWYIRKGFLKGVTTNLRDAIDEQFYSQLKHRHTAYRNTTPFQILEHLNSTWCPLDVQAKKKLKDAYFTQWD